ncbi:MAG TPA: anaerobic sulfatase maturase [Ignavibacteria bacterium]|nr:anaerobic sulfatase maturase [Ignavibacteria bacterium]
MNTEINYNSGNPDTHPAQRRFHIMAKPGGSTCNIDCQYCFYLDKGVLPDGPGSGRMSDEVLENFIRQYIEGVTANEIVFSWQGGEPTMLGLSYFKKIVELERKYARHGQNINNDLQTNGILLDDDWCKFLKENNWLVGISIDGPRDIHNAYRVTKNGKPTFDLVMNGIKLLKKYRVPFNTLTCVNRLNAKRPLDVYRFLRREVQSTYIQFIPIVEYKGFETTAPYSWDFSKLPIDGSPESKPGHPDSIVEDWSVDPDDYGYFLSKVFDEWLNRDVGRVLVNHIETLVAQHLGLPSQVCIYSEFCGKGLAVENEGSVYSCDHFVYPEYKLGNVKENNLTEMVFSPVQNKFGYDKSDKLPEYCKKCEYLTDCYGECPKNRILRTPDGEPGLNYLCRGLKKYFKHALPEVDKIVAGLKQNGINPEGKMRGR